MTRSYLAYAFIAFLALLTFIGYARADTLTIGLPTSPQHWWACKVQTEAEEVARTQVSDGYGIAEFRFRNKASCVQFKEPRSMFFHKVVWHHEFRNGEILKVLLASNPHDVNDKWYVLTMRQVAGSGLSAEWGITDGYQTASNVVEEPRLMYGMFCQTETQIQSVFSKGWKSERDMMQALAEENVKLPVCVLHNGKVSRLFVTRLEFVHTSKFGELTLWLYKATVEGIMFGDAGARFEPVEQYVFLSRPLNPAHVDNDA